MIAKRWTSVGAVVVVLDKKWSVGSKGEGKKKKKTRIESNKETEEREKV